MARVLLAGAVALALTGVVHAEPKRKVNIESEPSGASIFFNAVDEGEFCKTPCKDVEAPLGSYPIIVQKAGYGEIIDTIEVTKKGQRTFKYKLASQIGFIAITNPVFKGAVIRIDDEDKGKAPDTIEVSGGDAHRVLIKSAKIDQEEYVTVESGETVE